MSIYRKGNEIRFQSESPSIFSATQAIILHTMKSLISVILALLCSTVTAQSIFIENCAQPGNVYFGTAPEIDKGEQFVLGLAGTIGSPVTSVAMAFTTYARRQVGSCGDDYYDVGEYTPIFTLGLPYPGVCVGAVPVVGANVNWRYLVVDPQVSITLFPTGTATMIPNGIGGCTTSETLDVFRGVWNYPTTPATVGIPWTVQAGRYTGGEWFLSNSSTWTSTH